MVLDGTMYQQHDFGHLVKRGSRRVPLILDHVVQAFLLLEAFCTTRFGTDMVKR